MLLPCDAGRNCSRSEHELERELDHAPAARGLDLPEVLLRLLGEGEPPARVADVVGRPGRPVRDAVPPDGADRLEVQVDVTLQRVGSRLVEEVEEAGPELELPRAPEAEVLEHAEIPRPPPGAVDVVGLN